MLFPEEETVSSVVEKGSFYTHAAQAEFDETPTLQKATLMIIPGAVLALILPLLLPSFTLTHFLASILLIVGFLPLLWENSWFKIGCALSVLQLAYAVWQFVAANLIPSILISGTVLNWIIFLSFGIRIGIMASFWAGIRRIHKAAGHFALIALGAYCILSVLPMRSIPLLIAKICAALVCTAALVAVAIKVRK